MLLEIHIHFDPTVGGAITSTCLDGMIVQSSLVCGMRMSIRIFSVIVITYLDPDEPGMTPLALGGAAIFFMQVLVSAHHFIILYMALEGLSLMRFILAAKPKSDRSVEGGLKYYVLSSLASVLRLMGIAVLYRATNSWSFASVRNAMNDSGNVMSELTATGFFLITIAFRFKLSAFPGHF